MTVKARLFRSVLGKDLRRDRQGSYRSNRACKILCANFWSGTVISPNRFASVVSRNYNKGVGTTLFAGPAIGRDEAVCVLSTLPAQASAYRLQPYFFPSRKAARRPPAMPTATAKSGWPRLCWACSGSRACGEPLTFKWSNDEKLTADNLPTSGTYGLNGRFGAPTGVG